MALEQFQSMGALAVLLSLLDHYGYILRGTIRITTLKELLYQMTSSFDQACNHNSRWFLAILEAMVHTLSR